MKRVSLSVFRVLLLALAFAWLPSAASAASIPIGYVYYLESSTGVGAFNIVNMTGANNTGLPWESLDPIDIANINLVVSFASGGPQNFTGAPGPDFVLNADGLSWDFTNQTTAFSGGAPTLATLTGTLSAPGMTVNTISYGSQTLLPGPFSATIFAGSSTADCGTAAGFIPGTGPLEDAACAIIYATVVPTAPPPPGAVPEPGTMLLIGTGVAALVRKRMKSKSTV